MDEIDNDDMDERTAARNPAAAEGSSAAALPAVGQSSSAGGRAGGPSTRASGKRLVGSTVDSRVSTRASGKRVADTAQPPDAARGRGGKRPALATIGSGMRGESSAVDAGLEDAEREDEATCTAASPEYDEAAYAPPREMPETPPDSLRDLPRSFWTGQKDYEHGLAEWTRQGSAGGLTRLSYNAEDLLDQDCCPVGRVLDLHDKNGILPGWVRVKVVRPHLGEPLQNPHYAESAANAYFLPAAEIPSHLAILRESGFLTAEECENAQDCFAATRDALLRLYPTDLEGVLGIRYALSAFEIEWPPEHAGKVLRYVQPIDSNLMDPRGSAYRFGNDTIPSGLCLSDALKDEIFAALRDHRVQWEWEDPDPDAPRTRHQLFNSAVRGFCISKRLCFLLQSPYFRTVASTLGNFDATLPFKPGAAPADPEEWARSLSCPLGAVCDLSYDHHEYVRRRADHQERLVHAVQTELTGAAAEAYAAIHTLTSKPWMFAYELKVLRSSARSIRLRTHVSIRPSACFPHRGGREWPEELSRLMGLLMGSPAPSLVDQRNDPDIPMPPPPVHSHDQTAKQRKDQRVAHIVHGVLDALESISAQVTEEADSPPGISVQLLPFQRRTLAWMLARERNVPDDMTSVQTPSSGPLWFGRDSFHLYPPAHGGFIMQEMGMGKSLETLALVLANPRPAGKPGTLILCPPTLLPNWESECRKLLTPSTSVLLLDSKALSKARKATDDAQVALLSSPDVVITSYTVLEKSPVHSVRWHRLVLDESQGLKNEQSSQCRNVSRLRAQRRWALSGTPMPNTVDDLQGQFHALQLSPYDRRFNYRLRPTANRNWSGAECATPQPLLKFLGTCSIRHCKEGLSAADGGESAHVSLPPVTFEEQLVEPSSADRAAYDALHRSISERVRMLSRAGSLGVRVAALNGLLLKLRIACDHSSLAKDALARMAQAAAEAKQLASASGVREASLEQLVAEAGGDDRKKRHLKETLGGYSSGCVPDCPICLDEMLTPTLTGECSLPHTFCLSCLPEVMRDMGGTRMGRCPLCREQITEKRLTCLRVTPPEEGDGGSGASEGEAAAAGEAGDAMAVDVGPAAEVSTKLDALVAALRTDTAAHPKTVVFTHFAAAQPLVAKRLEREGIRFEQIAPGFTHSKRAKALHAFKSDASVSCFLLSMRSAAVGLTLTEASRLMLLEPGLNLATEAQAIGRVHRFGQTRPCHVIKFGLRGTVEERILHMNRPPPSDHAACASASAASSGAAASAAAAAPAAPPRDGAENRPPQAGAAPTAAAAGAKAVRAAQVSLTSEQICLLLA
jgi:SNF2 family DNA or RNA helicase